MAATPLVVDDAYVPWNKRKFDWVPTIADITAPTRLEIDAGTDVSQPLIEAPGWTVNGSTVESQSFVGAALKLPGPPTIADSSLTTRLSTANPDARDLYGTIGTAGFVVKFPEGDVTGGKMDVFKVVSNGDTDSEGVADPATTATGFAILAYELRVDIPV